MELFEGSDRLGGVLWTHRESDLLVERGADSFLRKLPWAVELCKELGLEQAILPTNETQRRALVVRDGHLYPVPEGFVVMRPNRLSPVLRSPLLSLRGKLRLIKERWVPAAKKVDGDLQDESVASFAIRRLGQETFDRLVQPLLAGIYTADPEKLSLAATMPAILEDEQKHGSLIKAAVENRKSHDSATDSQASGARYASFVSLEGGLQQLIEVLAEQLSEKQIHLNSKISSIAKNEDGRWSILLSNATCMEAFDGVIVALPAPRAAEVVSECNPILSELLGLIPYASSAVVSVLLNRDKITKALDGFGVVVPTIEGLDIVAASFSSIKFPGRASKDKVLVRVFLGGALRPEMVDHTDDTLQEIATHQLSALIGYNGTPTVVDIVRWREKMPQYHVGHLQIVDKIESTVKDQSGLELAGNAYHGVGIPQCVRSGEEAAKRLVAYLSANKS